MCCDWESNPRSSTQTRLYPMIWLFMHDPYHLISYFIAVCRDSYFGLCLWFWPSGKMIGIQRINENHYKYNDLQASVSFAIEEIRPYCLYVILGDSWWFSMILSDSQISLILFWGDSQWFANHSETFSGWFPNHSEIVFRWFLVIFKPLWNCFGAFLVIHAPLWNCFGMILSNSRGFLVILGISLKLFWGDSWWFANHSVSFCKIMSWHNDK